MIYCDRELSKRIERTEATVNASIVEAHARLSPETRVEWIEVAGAYALFDGAYSPCTQTFGLGLFNEATSTDFDQLETFFKERNTPVFHEISPLADPSLLTLLNERRYQPCEYTNIMFFSLDQLSDKSHSLNPDITVRIIEASEVNLWVETSARAWASEMPEAFEFMCSFGLNCAESKNSYSFIAQIDGKPIATSTLFIVNDVAMIVGTSTISEQRNQGAQTALINAHLHFALKNSCKTVLMAASPGSQSQKNAEKNGFRIAYTRTKWKLFDNQ